MSSAARSPVKTLLDDYLFNSHLPPPRCGCLVLGTPRHQELFAREMKSLHALSAEVRFVVSGHRGEAQTIVQRAVGLGLSPTSGPPPLDATALAMRRYGMTTLVEDLGDARRSDEAPCRVSVPISCELGDQAQNAPEDLRSQRRLTPALVGDSPRFAGGDRLEGAWWVDPRHEVGSLGGQKPCSFSRRSLPTGRNGRTTSRLTATVSGVPRSRTPIVSASWGTSRRSVP